MGTIANDRFGDLHVHVQPNSWFHMLADHAVVFSVLPLAPDQDALRTTWLVHADAVEGVDYDLATLAKVWNATNAEDSAFVARTQRGVQDPGYEPGPYSKVEGDVDAFVTLVRRPDERASRREGVESMRSAVVGHRYRAGMGSTEEKAKLNQSVMKAITLLRATAEEPNANVSSLARAAGLPRATALRMIQTLEQEGFLLRNPGRTAWCSVRSCCGSRGTPTSSCSSARLPARSWASWSTPSGRP